MSLTINQNIETTGVTSFESEACDMVSVLGQHLYKPRTAPLQADIQNLTEYFARPRLIFSGTIGTGQTPVYTAPITSSNMYTTLFPNGVLRLTGVYGTRFRLVFTMQLATTPFHQGLLAMSWQYGDVVTTSVNLGLTARGVTLGMQTNVPHVRLDLADTTMATLSVPYLSPFEFLPITDLTPYGFLSIMPLLPVTSGTGTTAPTLRLYVHLEDMELVGAVAPDVSAVVLQSGRKVSPVTAEFNRDSHPFSSALNSAAMTFSYIAKGVPSLGSLAGPPSWFLGHAAAIARYFGFSRPALVEPPQRMFPQSHANDPHVDLPALTNLVGPFQGNTLAVSPEFAHTTVDEMSIPYIISQYSQICIGNLATTMASGTMLYATAVSPSSFWFRSRLTGAAPFSNIRIGLRTPVNTQAFVPSNLFYMGSVFRYWKGSLRFRISFAKTKFHGGRVLAFFNPDKVPEAIVASPGSNTINALTAGTFGPQPFGYSKLFDLRDSNVFEFDVPYINNTPYCSFWDNAGSFSVYVQDPLISPTTVPSSVPFLVEVRALDDFEFASPITPTFAPMNATTVGTGITYQSGKLVTLARDEDCTTCIGEKVTSVKQLISIPKFSTGNQLLANTLTNFTVYPWWYGSRLTATATNTATFTLPNEVFGYGNYFANAYTFVKGSTDVHFYFNNVAGHDIYTGAFLSPANGNVQVNTNTPENTPASNQSRIIQVDNNYGVHLRSPAYQFVQRLWSYGMATVAYAATGRVNFPGFVFSPNAVLNLTVATTSTAGTQWRRSIAAGDDAALGLYIGPPLLFRYPVDSTVLSYDPDSTGLL